MTGDYAPDSLLVRFAPGASEDEKAQVRAALGAELVQAYELVPGLEHLRLMGSASVMDAVAAADDLPSVSYIEPDYVVRATLTPNDPDYSKLYGMTKINAPAAWDLTTGNANVIVAIIDTGVNTDHPDLNDNIWVNTIELNGIPGVDDDGNNYVDDVRGWDFWDNDNTPTDPHGHGTHTAGTSCAEGNNGTGVVGVAWRCKIMPLRFLGPSGSGYWSGAIGALNYAVAKGVKISNNSYGASGYVHSFYDALVAARAQGHLFVAAAGNYATNTDNSPFVPASYNLDNVISVAATDNSDLRASFSNYGQVSVDLGAPGVSIYSTHLGGYASMSGTSMAAPHVAGAAALVMSAHPGWTYAQVRDRLFATARPVESLAGKTVTGGILNIGAAVGGGAPPPTPIPPTPVPPDPGGLNGAVRALAADAGGNFYAGGDFTKAHSLTLNHITRWDGQEWQALGAGIGGTVFALAVAPDGSVYAGGNFFSAGGQPAASVARWNGSSWQALGSGINGPVYALAVDNLGNLYAGGEFSLAGGVAANGIARWNGASWSALGSGVGGLSYPYVSALLWSGGDLFVGGRFVTAGGIAVNHVAKWYNNQWHALSNGVGDGVNYAAVYALGKDSSGNLYAAGDFPKIGGVNAGSIAFFNGVSWIPLGAGVNGWIWDLAADANGNLYAGGEFSTAGGSSARNIARWHVGSESWSALGAGADDTVVALATTPGRLVAGGEFRSPANYIASWDSNAWSKVKPTPIPPSPLGSPSDENWHGLDESGLDGPVKALAFDTSGTLYGGGDFRNGYGKALNGIARWDGVTWQPIGGHNPPGFSGSVLSLAFGPDGSLYAGGAFNYAYGYGSALHIARWNGSTWGALGAGINGPVYAMAFDATGNLYVGGEFTQAGGVPANGIAKWNGATWSALGLGVGGIDYPYVHALMWDNGQLYAGGRFTAAGGVTVNHIARWNGSMWSPLGFGVGDGVSYAAVYALLKDADGTLVAAGDFPRIGGVGAGSIARWNGSSWQVPGTGVNGWVWDLARDSSGNLYAGGEFSAAGGIAASKIAVWNGAAWSALGTGMDDGVFALATDSKGTVYAGGAFHRPGNFVASWAAGKWVGMDIRLSPINALLADSSGNLYVGDYNNVTRWDGVRWHALGSEFLDAVRCLALDASGNLYAGGSFTTAGGVPVNRIARWDGARWQPLGAGFDSTVLALAVDADGLLYAGGLFTHSGTLAVNHVAVWDGAQWHALGAGANDSVFAFAAGPAGVFAGGAFTAAGGVAANNIARWDGTTWHPLGAGVNGWVVTLGIDRAGDIYAGGGFSTAGGSPVNNIARWDGLAWSPLQGGVNGTVTQLVRDSTGGLYVRGAFTTAGSTAAHNAAHWSGSQWQPMGSGIDKPGYGQTGLTLDGSGNLFTSSTRSQDFNGYIMRWTASDYAAVSGSSSHVLYVNNLPVKVNITQPGTLRHLYIQRHDKSHPNAGAGLVTGYYWELAGLDAAGTTASGYTLDLTLPTVFTPDADDKVCRYTGFGLVWDCGADGRAANSITRTGVKQLGFWAAQNNERPPTVTPTATPIATATVTATATPTATGTTALTATPTATQTTIAPTARRSYLPLIVKN